MNSVQLLASAIRRALHDGHVTAAELANLRRLARSALDDDTTSAEDVRAALSWAISDLPNMRSFKTDSGQGGSRAF